MKNNLYIQMFSIHGLFRAENLEMGRDADTGGQIKYVVELGKALSSRKDIKQVDIFTRLIVDKTVSEDYAQPVEIVNDKLRIVRIQCGGKKYIRKELLWPHLDEFVDKTIKFIRKEKQLPDIIHGHYADGGYVAGQLAELFGTPFIFTGHSLGRAKKEKLLADGLDKADVNKKYKIDHRIAVEEDVLKSADLIVTSTHQEIEKQYEMYQCNKMPVFSVIPPGLDIEKFHPYYHDNLPQNDKDESERFAQASIREELNRFFMQTDKPLILAICRPDKRKNITGLVKAYGEDKELQSMANLAIFAGIRKDISRKEDNEKDVLTRMLLLMDKYDLYGKMAIPKKHDFEYEVPELYRIAAENKGVFMNTAFTEPFGITLIEAAAVGLPIIATNDGGPQDIIKNCKCGVLIDPSDSRQISSAAKKIISDADLWKTYSRNGTMNIRKHYIWENHAKKYLKELGKLKLTADKTNMGIAKPGDAIGRRIIKLNHFIVSDIDNTLTGGDVTSLKKLITMIKNNRNHIGFGVATGRPIESTVKHLKEHRIIHPDVIISSVGAELYYGKNQHFSKGWETHISKQWDREKIKRLLDRLKFLEYQEEDTQRPFKVSYNMKPGKDNIARVHDILIRNKCRYSLIFSHEKYLDILPFRASKGKAIRYLSYKWDIPLSNFLVCGDSGNDEEMLKGVSMGVVVGNYSKELEGLKSAKNVYFANKPYSGGIIEGLAHYNFIDKASGA